MSKKDLIQVLGLTFLAGAFLTAGGITAAQMLNKPRLENRVEQVRAERQYNPQDYVPSNNTQAPQYAMPAPSAIQSDLPPQNQFIGYQIESVPQIVQTMKYKTVVTTPLPLATAVRAVAGVRPVIPDWRKATVPYVKSHVIWNQVAKPLYTSAPIITQPQYVMPPPGACKQVQIMPQLPAPPQPGYR